MNPFETIGRKQVALENLQAEYDRLLALAGSLVSGEIDRAHVTIDQANRSWRYDKPAAQANGKDQAANDNTEPPAVH